MKVALYIEDGVAQIVLTPESDFERGVIKDAAGKELAAKIFEGQFYDVRGGWTRQTDYFKNREEKDRSLIIRFARPDKEINANAQKCSGPSCEAETVN